MWVVAPVTSVGFVLAFARHRGALIGVPLVVVATLLLHPHPVRALGLGLLAYVAILAAAGLSGLAFAAIGHRLLRVPYIGAPLGFSLSALPYTLCLGFAVGIGKGTPWREWPSDANLFASGLVAILIGAMITLAYRTADTTSDTH
jgi:hypothetical protein